MVEKEKLMEVVLLKDKPYRGPGMIRSWAESCGHGYSEISPDEAAPEDFDMLIVLGGAHTCIEGAIARGKRVLGIGEGALVIGETLGAPREQSPEREYGFYYVEIEGVDPLTDHFHERFQAMHWHSEMPGLPEGSERLAFSEGCPRQIVRFREGVYGFLCHLEMTPYDVQEMAQNSNELLTPGKFVMSEKGLKMVHCGEMNTMMWHFLSYMEDQCLESSGPSI
jgi:GMP synthase (glutamine-hydrolysing)